MFTPVVTVLMPVYNGDKFLAAAIESILTQTFRDFELIVVDDGSFDSSNEIIKKYQIKDPRVILITQENEGIVAALNKALFSARGYFCMRMDADDVCLPDRIEKQLNFLKENSEVFVVGGQGYIIDEEGDFIRPLPVLVMHDEINDDLLYRFNSRAIIHPAVMFRTDEIRKIGGYRDGYLWAEDLDLFLRVAEVGKLANLDSVVIHYRKHGNSITDKKSVVQRNSAIKATNDARLRRGMPIVSYNDSIFDSTEESPLDSMYSTATSALSSGWRKTSIKYLRRMVSEYGLTHQAVKLSLKIAAAPFNKINSLDHVA